MQQQGRSKGFNQTKSDSKTRLTKHKFRINQEFCLQKTNQALLCQQLIRETRIIFTWSNSCNRIGQSSLLKSFQMMVSKQLTPQQLKIIEKTTQLWFSVQNTCNRMEKFIPLMAQQKHSPKFQVAKTWCLVCQLISALSASTALEARTSASSLS